MSHEVAAAVIQIDVRVSRYRCERCKTALPAVPKAIAAGKRVIATDHEREHEERFFSVEGQEEMPEGWTSPLIPGQKSRVDLCGDCTKFMNDATASALKAP